MQTLSSFYVSFCQTHFTWTKQLSTQQFSYYSQTSLQTVTTYQYGDSIGQTTALLPSFALSKGTAMLTLHVHGDIHKTAEFCTGWSDSGPVSLHAGQPPCRSVSKPVSLQAGQPPHRSASKLQLENLLLSNGFGWTETSTGGAEFIQGWVLSSHPRLHSEFKNFK